MATQRTKFVLGLFVTCGIGIAFLAVIWLGVSRFFEEGQYYVTYFNESVQGLDVDSPVKYRGVFIGRVERIDVAPDANLIQVVLKIESGQKLNRDTVAQLKSVGITGSMFIELDRKKAGEPDRSPCLSFPSEYPIVASKPSNIHQMLQSIDDVLHQLKAMDLVGISRKIHLTLDSINGAVEDADVKGISYDIETLIKNTHRILDPKRWDTILASVEKAGQSLNGIMDQAGTSLNRVDNTVHRIDGITAEKEESIKIALENFREAMENANTLLKKGNSLTDKANESLPLVRQRLLTIAGNLEKASKNLNRLIETVADHPSQLMFGEPPIPRSMESAASER